MPSFAAASTNAGHCGSLLPTTPMVTVSLFAAPSDPASESDADAQPARDAIRAMAAAAAATVVIRRDMSFLPLVGTQKRYAPIHGPAESRRHMTSRSRGSADGRDMRLRLALSLRGGRGRSHGVEERRDHRALLGGERRDHVESAGMRPPDAVPGRRSCLVGDLDGQAPAIRRVRATTD